MTSKRARRAEAALGADLSLATPPVQSGDILSGEIPPERTEARHSGGGRRATKRSRSAKAPAEPSQAAEASAAPTAAESAPEDDALSAAFVVPEDAVVRRTKDGWRVGTDVLPDLTCAMILADLIAAETGMPDARPSKPPIEAVGSGETGKLKATVGQLEHALLTRIRVEQAIGVLAERHRIKPRQAFEQLREAARSRGRKVIDIAGDVVASATNPLLQLPDELSRPRSGPRRARQSFN
jgi:ANTAR domain